MCICIILSIRIGHFHCRRILLSFVVTLCYILFLLQHMQIKNVAIVMGIITSFHVVRQIHAHEQA